MRAKPKVGAIQRYEVLTLLTENEVNLSDDEKEKLARCLKLSVEIFYGLANDKLVCLWGLIPPTLMSDQAYLWMFATDAIREHEFMFVRHSQRAIEEMLKQYPMIIGHMNPVHHNTRRWLRLLGASFGEPDGPLVPFTIRKKASNG